LLFVFDKRIRSRLTSLSNIAVSPPNQYWEVQQLLRGVRLLEN